MNGGVCVDRSIEFDECYDYESGIDQIVKKKKNEAYVCLIVRK